MVESYAYEIIEKEGFEKGVQKGEQQGQLKRARKGDI